LSAVQEKIFPNISETARGQARRYGPFREREKYGGSDRKSTVQGVTSSRHRDDSLPGNLTGKKTTVKECLREGRTKGPAGNVCLTTTTGKGRKVEGKIKELGLLNIKKLGGKKVGGRRRTRKKRGEKAKDKNHASNTASLAGKNRK